MDDYVGEDRRNNPQSVGIVISGSKVPMTVFVSGIATLIASIIYATIWLSKLDERVLRNAQVVAASQAVNVEQNKTLSMLQRNADKTTIILEGIVERLDRLEDGQ